MTMVEHRDPVGRDPDADRPVINEFINRPAFALDPRRACRTVPREDFYSESISGVARAMAVCNRCPEHIRQACLDWAILKNEVGVWGGTTERDRRKIRRILLREW